MSAWFNNPQELFNEKKLKSFWPTATQTVGERVNASTRFIIYACVILFVIQKDPRVLVMGGVSIGILYTFWQSKIISDPVLRPAQADGRGPSLARGTCEAPDLQNPMANVLMSDYTEYPDRPSACYYPQVKNQIKNYLDDSFPQDGGDIWGSRNQAASRFYSMPNTQIPNDQEGFAQAAFGPQTGGQRCTANGAPSCSPNARGVQGEALGGLDSLGQNQPRSGF